MMFVCEDNASRFPKQYKASLDEKHVPWTYHDLIYCPLFPYLGSMRIPMNNILIQKF
ncbi:hypothetical protein HanRHA438_Chr08g0342241 [Helianthus annuus]|nr:hypothetical protein HanRHA438_Chr08g0342241 [Helianthus annuus]